MVDLKTMPKTTPKQKKNLQVLIPVYNPPNFKPPGIERQRQPYPTAGGVERYEDWEELLDAIKNGGP